jgi:hypothetical protein
LILTLMFLLLNSAAILTNSKNSKKMKIDFNFFGLFLYYLLFNFFGEIDFSSTVFMFTLFIPISLLHITFNLYDFNS